MYELGLMKCGHWSLTKWCPAVLNEVYMTEMHKHRCRPIDSACRRDTVREAQEAIAPMPHVIALVPFEMFQEKFTLFSLGGPFLKEILSSFTLVTVLHVLVFKVSWRTYHTLSVHLPLCPMSLPRCLLRCSKRNSD